MRVVRCSGIHENGAFASSPQCRIGRRRGLAAWHHPRALIAGPRWVLYLVVCETSRAPRFSTSPSTGFRSRVPWERLASYGMMREQEREVSILVWTSAYLKVGTRCPDHTGTLVCVRGKQGQIEEKIFFLRRL